MVDPIHGRVTTRNSIWIIKRLLDRCVDRSGNINLDRGGRRGKRIQKDRTGRTDVIRSDSYGGGLRLIHRDLGHGRIVIDGLRSRGIINTVNGFGYGVTVPIRTSNCPDRAIGTFIPYREEHNTLRTGAPRHIDKSNTTRYQRTIKSKIASSERCLRQADVIVRVIGRGTNNR